MATVKQAFRLGVCGAILAGVYLGLAASAIAWDQPQWVRRIGTPNYESASGVTTDAAGNVYIFGSRQRPDGTSYTFIVKYSAAGQVKWTRRLGTSEPDTLGSRAIATDGHRNVYIAGETGLVSFTDIYIASYSLAGSLQWVRKLEMGGQSDWPTGIAVDLVGDIYVSGGSFTECFGSGEGGCLEEQNTGWIARYSAQGELLSRQAFGSEARDVATDRKGNVFVVWYGDQDYVSKLSTLGALVWQRPFAVGYGGTSAAADRDGNVYVSGYVYESGGNGTGGFVAKLSNAGTLQWTRNISASASDIATDSEGNIYISGGSGTNGDEDAWLASYSAAGALRWQRKFATEGSDSARAVSADANGNVYICGSTYNEEESDADAWLAKYYTRR